MEDILRKINKADWEGITEAMHHNGYAILPGLLTDQQCRSVRSSYDNPDPYRKTVVMARYRFGLGTYKYFDYPLPGLIEQIRTYLYTRLAPIANSWCKVLNMGVQFPLTHAGLLTECHRQEQKQATVLILKYGPGGFNTLHQDLYGDIYFPMQVVLMLSEPDEDYTGGEFVLTQQIPRAQSKVTVLRPKKGDAVIFTTNFRPEKGSRGYYRVNVKHGVSEVKKGERYTLGVIFHDANN
ncbi:2OG-Fe(II) oxygenase [Arachidicoccus terrestris]|uniref:2OG-Fe(II) oxygenase n=1 Tax=Arachidicoccus terrestris TaxID=2875539 RepID=UPI001CC6F2F1|nr:2OG-Fe(II) oxygenase [Arachidicoccus terrestris]UAY56330.1 2OG-Fe(II) oxygenase [Arachidicoccus terrestris]